MPVGQIILVRNFAHFRFYIEAALVGACLIGWSGKSPHELNQVGKMNVLLLR